MIMRPEDGVWKIVHRHADLIATAQPALVVHHHALVIACRPPCRAPRCLEPCRAARCLEIFCRCQTPIRATHARARTRKSSASSPSTDAQSGPIST
jgi:hypothetical protein